MSMKKIPGGLRRLQRDWRFRHYLNSSIPLPEISPRQSAYREYLTSEHWVQFRAKIISIRGLRCERCKTFAGPFEVHHLTYVRIGKELETDVQVLCRDCHAAHHKSCPAIGMPTSRERAGAAPRSREVQLGTESTKSRDS